MVERIVWIKPVIYQDTDVSKNIKRRAHVTTLKTEKSPTVALLLCIFLGGIGAHRFYVGKPGTGILMLLTGGGFGIWYLIDLASLISNQFKDADGNTLEVSKNPPTFKKVITIFGIIYAVFFLFFISVFATVLSALFFATSGMTGVVHNQLTALSAGNIEKAYSYVSADTQKSASLEDFKRIVHEHPVLENYKTALFPYTEINNNVGIMKGFITSKDGTISMVEYHLIKEGDELKIQGFQFEPTTNDASESTSSNASEFKTFEDK